MTVALILALLGRFRAFYLGFHSVCASNALIMLRPEEVRMVVMMIRMVLMMIKMIMMMMMMMMMSQVEILVCGAPTMDLSELRKVSKYTLPCPKLQFLASAFANIKKVSL